MITIDYIYINWILRCTSNSNENGFSQRFRVVVKKADSVEEYITWLRIACVTRIFASIQALHNLQINYL